MPGDTRAHSQAPREPAPLKNAATTTQFACFTRLEKREHILRLRANQRLKQRCVDTHAAPRGKPSLPRLRLRRRRRRRLLLRV
jgi:hypothetical protein